MEHSATFDYIWSFKSTSMKNPLIVKPPCAWKFDKRKNCQNCETLRRLSQSLSWKLDKQRWYYKEGHLVWFWIKTYPRVHTSTMYSASNLLLFFQYWKRKSSCFRWLTFTKKHVDLWVIRKQCFSYLYK